MIMVTKTIIEDLAAGAAFLGCGGGGNPYVARLIAEEVLNRGSTISIIDLDELSDKDLVVTIGKVGTTAVSGEMIQHPAVGIAAIRALEDFVGKKATAVIPFEIGGGNSINPLYIAGLMNLPIVDGDGMGRAFPQLDMVTFDIYNHYLPCAAVTDIYGQATIFQANTQTELEKNIRKVVIELGGSAYIAQYFLSREDLHRSMVPKTVSLSIALGRLLNQSRHDFDVYEKMCHFFKESCYRQADVLFKGKVIDVERDNQLGFNKGKLVLEQGNERAEILFQNENLLYQDRHKKVVVPDLITVLDLDTATPLFSSEYAYGQRVCVMSVLAPGILTTAKALERWGPKAFNL